MSKVLKDTEVLEIIIGAIKAGELDDFEQYTTFLGGLGKLIADHFGGEFVCVSAPDGIGEFVCGSKPDGPDDLGFCLHFDWNESVPEDGGIYEKYDTDVSIEEWQKEGA